MADSVEPEERTPRRRRAASRPAGAPPKVTFQAPEIQTGLASDVPAAVHAPSDEPKRPTRRRATRKTAPAAAEEEVVVIGGEPATTPEPAETPEPAAAEAPVAAPDETVEAAEAAESVEAEAPQKPARRRRSTRAKAEPTPEEAESAEEQPTEAVEEDADEIASRIAAAEKAAGARKGAVVNPFMSEDDREQQLAALAGAIAAGDEDEDDEEEEEAAEEETPKRPARRRRSRRRPRTEGVEDDEESDEDSDADSTSDDSESDDSDSEGDVDSEDEDSDDDSDDEEEATERPRRRRRRGGRRRRRGGSAAQSDDSQDEEKSDDESSEESDDDSEDKDENNGDGQTTTRRRRRRRRRGGSSVGSDGQDDEVTGIEGSTRMEAKRQRRKESRAAGRRRGPILSEAEFLARRETVDRKIIVRQAEDYTQMGVVEDDILVEHYVDRESAASLIGNIYLGKIQNVLPSMEAAFIDIGRGRNAVLYAGEVDWDSFGVTGEDRKVENVLKSGQTIVVQVTKDPVGQKGARLTHHVSLPGRYIVYSPGGHLSGISRKLPDTERTRLRSVLANLIADNESVIVRTAAEGASEEDLTRDVNRLKAQWEVIEKRAKQGGAPHALYTEPDLTLRLIRDLFTEDFQKIIVQGNGEQDDAFDEIHGYVSHVAPNLLERVERYEPQDDKDVFAAHKLDQQISKALDRKVFLPSGGSLVIDRTEAMTVIDVNTGRFTGSGGNLEATVTSNNLEAAEEVVRQLRLRDIGGIIVVDFIDMVLPSNRELLLRRLVECLGRDRTRHQVSEVTSLGLVQLTRKKIGTGLHEAFTEPCECCNGQGFTKSEEPIESQSQPDGGDRPQRGRRRGRRN